MPDQPRVTIVTNGNYFANLALERLLTERPASCEFQVIITTGLRRQGGSRAWESVGLLRKWGARYAAYKVLTYALPLALQRFGSTTQFVTGTCRDAGLPVFRMRNVNSDEGLDAVRNFGPDLLVSVSCPYRIRPPMLGLPRIGCLNLHSSVLPAYAGVGTYVHVLARGEPFTGVTVHEMVEEFDAGRIVMQRTVPINEPTSVFRLFQDLCEIGGVLLAESVEACLVAGEIEGRPQDPSRRSYFGEPTAAEVADLRRHGHRLVSREDLRGVLAGARR